MVDLGLIKISKSNETNNENYYIKTKDLTTAFIEGKFKLNTKYSIIYLYDFMNDINSYYFLSKYGAKIHNNTSANISFITYLSSDMIEKWNNVQCRDQIRNKEIDYLNFYTKSLRDFKELFDIKKLPAIIITKNTKVEEKHIIIEVTQNMLENIDNIYKMIQDIITIINDNCEENFSEIFRKISPDAFVKENIIGQFNIFNKIGDLVKKEKSRLGKYTLEDLAFELGFSLKTLTNKRQNKSFTREECIYIAFRFKLKVQELNWLLYQTNNAELFVTGRDGVIKEILSDKLFLKSFNSIEKADTILRNNNYDGILKKDYIN